METHSLELARQRCPKRMHNGPCGGVTAAGMCEVDAALACPYLAITAELPWRNPRVAAERPPQRSAGRLEASLRAGAFVLIAEAYTPDSADLAGVVATYSALGSRITAVNIAEHALATPHASTLAAAALLERAGVETIVNLTCRDRNRIALQGEVLGAAALGIHNLFCITGDHPRIGDHPQAQAVYDCDSIELLQLARRMCDRGQLLSDRPLAVPPRLLLGGAASPFSPPYILQAERVAAKIAAGADFIQTQAIFDLDGFGDFVGQLRELGALERAWLIAGVALIGSLEQAVWLQRHVPGARVPHSLLAQLEATPHHRQREAGLRYSAEQIARLQAMPGVSGALLFPLMGDTDALTEVLELGTGARGWGLGTGRRKTKDERRKQHPSPLSRHPVTRSPGHPVTRSPSHPVTRSPGHPVTRSPGHPVTRSRRRYSNEQGANQCQR